MKKYSLDWEEISDEEFRDRMRKYYTEMQNLYDIMSSLTFEDSHKQYIEVSSILSNLGQYYVLPNTAWIERRVFEVFGKNWGNGLFKEQI